jgi:hypothetical protein
MIDTKLRPFHGFNDWIKQVTPSGEIIYYDHLGGFDAVGNNEVLRTVDPGSTVRTEYLLTTEIKQLYPKIDIKFDAELMIKNNLFNQAMSWSNTINKEYKNFLCCFNYGYHCGRELLVSKLFNLKWFNFDYCTKGFSIQDTGIDLSDEEKIFNRHISIIPKLIGYNLIEDLTALSPMIQKSFVHLVSETLPDSYIPFPTEKMLFPILNQTLWVAYAPPGYHNWVNQHLGIRSYSVFDYSFDSIQDPVKRLNALTEMLEPFSKMSVAQWQEIYQQEANIIKFNFDHVSSGAFMEHLRQFDQTK